ncbi:MAG TPA: GMC oxidoreductase, partial [Acidimicrobiales bacterium]|nr:GMC oxidoreductase [Acidimicrobiales bacterium]
MDGFPCPLNGKADAPVVYVDPALEYPNATLADLGFHEKSHQRGVYPHEGMNIAATAHQAGTARFGDDPATSVLDVNCKAHELDNLYVVDSSF